MLIQSNVDNVKVVSQNPEIVSIQNVDEGVKLHYHQRGETNLEITFTDENNKIKKELYPIKVVKTPTLNILTEGPYTPYTDDTLEIELDTDAERMDFSSTGDSKIHIEYIKEDTRKYFRITTKEVLVENQEIKYTAYGLDDGYNTIGDIKVSVKERPLTEISHTEVQESYVDLTQFDIDSTSEVEDWTYENHSEDLISINKYPYKSGLGITCKGVGNAHLSISASKEGKRTNTIDIRFTITEATTVQLSVDPEGPYTIGIEDAEPKTINFITDGTDINISVSRKVELPPEEETSSPEAQSDESAEIPPDTEEPPIEPPVEDIVIVKSDSSFTIKGNTEGTYTLNITSSKAGHYQATYTTEVTVIAGQSNIEGEE